MAFVKVHAVFEGGGVKGISLAGAVEAAERCGVAFEKVAGTSSGSIVAALLAAGYTAAEMREVIRSTPFRAFLRQAPIFRARIIGPALRLLVRKGLYSGDAMEEWVRTLLAAKGFVTFGDLPPGKLRIVASDITNGKLLVLPDDIDQYGMQPQRLSIARAVRMSASIPYFFDPVVLRQPVGRSGKRRGVPGSRVRYAYIVDGGLLSNFPLWLFDKEEESGGLPVLGFQMVGRTANRGRRITGPISMFQAMFETMLSAHDERYIEEMNRVRTIKIPTLGIGTTDFDLSPEQSDELYEAGLAAGEKFFRIWDRQTGKLRVELKRGAND